MTAEDDLFDAKVKVLSEQIERHADDGEEQKSVQARKSNLDLLALGEEIVVRKEQLLAANSAPWPYGNNPGSQTPQRLLQ